MSHNYVQSVRRSFEMPSIVRSTIKHSDPQFGSALVLYEERIITSNTGDIMEQSIPAKSVGCALTYVSLSEISCSLVWSGVPWFRQSFLWLLTSHWLSDCSVCAVAMWCYHDISKPSRILIKSGPVRTIYLSKYSWRLELKYPSESRIMKSLRNKLLKLKD